MKISVISPFYHGEKYLRPMILQVDAAARFSKLPVQLIIVNDDPDNWIDENISSQYIDVSIYNTRVNRGIHGARAYGIRKCTGDFVLLLDQDDRILPQYFKSQMASIGQSDLAICRLSQDGTLPYVSANEIKKSFGLPEILSHGNPIFSPGQVLIKRESIPEIWLDDILRVNGADDWLLWIYMLKAGCCVAYNEDILFERVIGYKNTSFNAAGMTESEWEVRDILLRNHMLDEKECASLDHFLKYKVRMRLLEYERAQKRVFFYKAWLRTNRKGNKLCEFFSNDQSSRFAIYGAGDVGQEIYAQLVADGKDVIGYIDRNSERIVSTIPIINTVDLDFCREQWNPDIVIISLIENEESVKSKLLDILQTRVYTIMEILNGEQ